ncbi:hypothetical protein SAMN05877809_106221 [Rhodobacter sp. JA431]|uniref:hypothetical protein n=1 Tax=Rhodobacter sp. JA431 TaxID=570013 RepID=UPI000BC8FDE9|nr:hypothetical protein [Rhodobacter sp. JA431]SOC13210.1 hypothetical protein SAMN05877809_106221 [Rhodobacter sp. JA431]
MATQKVIVEFELEDSQLYFDGLGELLSKQVTELCSKGNFGHDFAAGIYRTLAEHLAKTDFDSLGSRGMSQVANDGFDEVLHSPGEPTVAISITGPNWDEDFDRGQHDSWEVDRKFRESAPGKKLSALFEKFGRSSNLDDSQAIEALRKIAEPNISVFEEAEAELFQISDSLGFRTEPNREKWRSGASLEEIMQEEDKIVFIEDVLNNYFFQHLQQKCLRFCATEASIEDVSNFVALLEKLPASFVGNEARMASDDFVEWTKNLRGDLDGHLTEGMFMEDIKSFSAKHALSERGINIKNRIDHLVRTGAANKTKKNGKVFYVLAS